MMASHTQPSSPILRLPTELRLEIYRYLLVSGRTLRMVRRKEVGSSSPKNRLFPAILRTCRLVHSEAADVLYRDNFFLAHRVDESNSNAASIRRAKFAIDLRTGDNGEGDVSKLPSFLRYHQKLEHLVLEITSVLLENSTLRRLILDTFWEHRSSSRLTVTLDIQSSWPSFNAEQSNEEAEATALLLRYLEER